MLLFIKKLTKVLQTAPKFDFIYYLVLNSDMMNFEKTKCKCQPKSQTLPTDYSIYKGANDRIQKSHSKNLTKRSQTNTLTVFINSK